MSTDFDEQEVITVLGNRPSSRDIEECHTTQEMSGMRLPTEEKGFLYLGWKCQYLLAYKVGVLGPVNNACGMDLRVIIHQGEKRHIKVGHQLLVPMTSLFQQNLHNGLGPMCHLGVVIILESPSMMKPLEKRHCWEIFPIKWQR
jgi:hypothetical protein